MINVLIREWQEISIIGMIFLLFVNGIIPFIISYFCRNIFLRIGVFLFGISCIMDCVNPKVAILTDSDTYGIIALFIPQLQYYFELILNFINFMIKLFLELKNATVNTYYFTLTIVYKTLKLIRAIIKLFISIYNFFKYFSFKNILNSFKNNFKNFEAREEAKKRYSNYEYEETENPSFRQRYKNFFDEDNQQKNNSNNHQKQREKQQYEEEQRRYKEQQEKQKKDDGIPKEFRQFFSDDPYIILGVSRNDSKEIIKKQYRNLMKKYHPDKQETNHNFFTAIAQKLNWAYEQIG